MPCRRPGSERFLLLERAAVTLPSGPVVGSTSSGSREVDALVAKLGEVLQLNAQHRTPPLPAAPAVAATPATPCLLLPPKHHSRDRAAPYASPRGLGFFASLRPPHSSPHPSLVLLQTPVHPPPPPPPPTTDAPGGSPRVAKQLCGRGWLRSAARAGRKKRQHYHHHHHHHPHPLLSAGDDDDDEEDDPHRLLQQLILSGNLIKEAVRRLQLATTVATTAAAASETSTTGSPGSASSTGSCCTSSDGGGSERDSDAAFAVSSLQALP